MTYRIRGTNSLVNLVYPNFSQTAANRLFAGSAEWPHRNVLEVSQPKERVAAGTDVLLTAFGPAPLSRAVAEAFGIPSVGAYFLPAVPTVEFPLPGWPEPGWAGPRN